MVSATIGAIAPNEKFTTVSMTRWQHPEIYIDRCDTDGKFAAGVNTRLWMFATDVNLAGYKVSPVPTTPVVNNDN
jgi:hypothetical protein